MKRLNVSVSKLRCKIFIYISYIRFLEIGRIAQVVAQLTLISGSKVRVLVRPVLNLRIFNPLTVASYYFLIV